MEKTFSVNVFLGKDKVIRLVPGVRNRFGIYVPIPEGVEVPLMAGAEEIGNAYFKASKNALAHFGEDLDMRKAKPKYVSFKKFKSQRDFNANHFCFSSFAYNGKIKFTFLPWHNGEFCLLKSDVVCEEEIPIDSNERIIGNSILSIFQAAAEKYPEQNILSDNHTMHIDTSIEKNTTTLFVYEASEEFSRQLRRFTNNDVNMEDLKEGLQSFSSASLSCLLENDISKLEMLSQHCSELYCFSLYSTVGFYGFFHFLYGQCLRGYASLDEDGIVKYNIGETSKEEIVLKLHLPKTSDDFAKKRYDALNATTIQQLASLMIK